MEDKLRRTRFVFVFAILAAFLILPGALMAQSTAQISGTVNDPSGAVLPGVEITVTQTDTGITRSAVSNETGTYNLPSLPIGPYKLEASLPGFRTYAQTGIVLQVGSSPVFNIRLEVGQVTETVEVQADAALVETRNTGIGQVIDNVRVLELPLNGRQVTELVLLSGVANITPDAPGGSLNSGARNYPTIVISVAGGMQAGLTYNLDGANHNDAYNNLNLPLPFPDALQEFKVETSGIAAQYGFHSSGQVNAITKSGTNAFHGDLFEFVRNGRFNARNAFALANDGLKRNQFGGTIGGPILRNKLFFFAGEQGTKERSSPSDLRGYIPTTAMLAGDFTTFASAGCNSGRPVTLRAPFVNNRVDPSLFSKVAVNLTKQSLFPQTSDPCGEVRFGRRVKTDEWLTTGRVDYQMNDKHSVFGRYLEARRNQPTDFDGKNILTMSNGNLVQRIYTLAIGDTYLLSPTAVASFRGAINRGYLPKTPPQTFDLTSLGAKGIYDTTPGLSFLNVSNGFSLASGNVNPGFQNTTSFNLREDLSIERGTHQFGIGGSWVHENLNGGNGFFSTPNPAFDGHFTGTGLSDFLLGKAATFSQGNPIPISVRQNIPAFYGQDSWKMTPRFTVSAGFRWEPHLAPYGVGKSVHFEKEWFKQGVKSTVFTNAPVGLQYVGDPLYLAKGNKFDVNSLLHFAPRLGFAWDVSGDGKTTIRSSYGLFFDLPPMYHWGGNHPPYSNQVTVNDPPGGLDDIWAGYPGGNPFPTVLTKDARFGQQVSYITFGANFASTYVHQWNLSLQRQIGSDWMVSANYVGNSTIHAPGAIEANPVIYIPGASTTGNANQRRELYLLNPDQGKFYATVQELNADSTSSYNGMLLSVQRRRSNGLTVQGNYTLSHCIADDIIAAGNSTTRALVYPGRRRDERKACVGDTRHSFNMSTVYETPQFSNNTVRLLASGWQVSGIVRIQSGDYFTVMSGFNTALRSGLGTNRADQISDPYLPNKGVNGWLDPKAFVRPADGFWGSASQNILGPGAITINAGLTRSFKVTEGQAIQFRAEAFNLPNHMNPNDPILLLNNQNFGKIQSAKDPRIMQFALKYTF